MNLTRRAFLKLFAAGAAVVAVIPSEVLRPLQKALAQSDALTLHEYGQAIPLPVKFSSWKAETWMEPTYGPKGGVRRKKNWRPMERTQEEADRLNSEAKAFNEGAFDMVVKRLKVAAKKVLPPGTPYEIRRPIPGDFGRDRQVAWYYHPGFLYELERPKTITISRLGAVTMSRPTPLRRKPVWRPQKLNRFTVETGVIIVERCVA